MSKKVVLFFAVSLLLVFVNALSCTWIGTEPWCDASCSDCPDSRPVCQSQKRCTIGKKIECCEEEATRSPTPSPTIVNALSCTWIGTEPWCDASCSDCPDSRPVCRSQKRCTIGKKIECCEEEPTRSPTPSPTIITQRYKGSSLWGDIKTGHKILIKFYTGGYLKDDGDGTLSTSPIFDSQNFVWEVRTDYFSASGDRQFKNVKTGKFLKKTGSYCKTGTIQTDGYAASWNVYSVKTPIAALREYMTVNKRGTSTCCQAGSAISTNIPLSSCTATAAYYTFEILQDVTPSSPIPFFFVSSPYNRYEGTSIWDDIMEGDKVLIKSYFGGYLKDDGDGTISTNTKFNSLNMIWEIKDDYIGHHIQFKNVATNKFLKNNGAACISGSITGSGDAGSWRLQSITMNSESFDYRREYVYIINNKHSECCQSNIPSDTSIISGGCSSNTYNYYTLEIFETASAAQSALSIGFNVNDVSDHGITSSMANILNSTPNSIFIFIILAILLIINIFCCKYQIKKLCKNNKYELVNITENELSDCIST